MSLRTKFYTLWKGCFDNFLWSTVPASSFCSELGAYFPPQLCCAGALTGPLTRLLVMAHYLPVGYSYSNLSIRFSRFYLFQMPGCRNKSRHWNQKNKAPRRMIFTHHLPEALQNYLRCAILSTRKRSNKSVKMGLSSFGRMPGGCWSNRLCYGSIFYSLFAFDYSLPPSSNLFKSSFLGFKIIFYTYFIVIKWIYE